MANVMVPSLYPGERSLPAELRTARGVGFAQRRMAMSLQPSANPSYWNKRRLMLGMSGLGQDDDSDGSDFLDTSTGTDTGISDTLTIPLDTTNVDIPLVSAADSTYTATGGNLTSVFTGMGVDPTTAAAVAPYAASPSGYSGPNVAGPSASVPAAPTGYQWATLINQSGQNIAKILTIATGGSSVTLPNGTQLLYGANASSTSGALGSLSALTGISSSTLLLLGGAVVLFMVMEKK